MRPIVADELWPLDKHPAGSERLTRRPDGRAQVRCVEARNSPHTAVQTAVVLAIGPGEKDE